VVISELASAASSDRVRAGRKLHVLLLPSEEYIPRDNPLAGIFEHHQATALRQAGHRIGVLSVRQEYSIPMLARAALMRALRRSVQNALDDVTVAGMARLLRDKVLHVERFVTEEALDEGPVIRVKGFYFLPPNDRTNHFGWIRAGRAAFERYRQRHGLPDIIHVHSSNPAALLARRLYRQLGIPYVITEHSSFYKRGLVPKGLYPALRAAVRDARRLLVVSPALGEVLARELGECAANALWVPNVVEQDLLDAPLATPPRREGACVLLALGNLIPTKNHALLLAAFRQRLAASPAARVRIGGDGPLRGALERQARELGISGQVDLLGRLDRGQVLQELDRCDALVLPSEHETFGVVAIEALARGRPVIATRCGGPEHFITPEDGLLVPRNDVEALSAAMVTLRENATRYRPEEIRRRAIDRFGSRRLVESLEQVYAHALAAHV
jgi:glycosyltransferase involved in cell wall biosynthesis